jgi:hypothetical protein
MTLESAGQGRESIPLEIHARVELPHATREDKPLFNRAWVLQSNSYSRVTLS